MSDMPQEQLDQMWLQFSALGAEAERERTIKLLENKYEELKAEYGELVKTELILIEILINDIKAQQ